MTVNLEIKGMLARLLATEDIIVEHRKVETACFNVHTRVLTLPMWERASDTVYSLLVAHEVGHSRETPDIDWTQDNTIPPTFVNIVEDARVEKLMKRRYAGLAKTFYNGYKELNDQDFFCLKDDNIDTYNLADKANLFFKIGNFVNLTFTAEEQNIIDMIADAETFGDVLIAAEELYKYCKKNQNEETKVASINSHENGGNSGSSTDTSASSQAEESDDEEGESNSDNNGTNDSSSMTQGDTSGGENQGSQNNPTSTQGGEKSGEPVAKTMENLENSIRDLMNLNGVENIYVEVPKLDLKKVIISNAEIHGHCNETWTSQAEYLQSTTLYTEPDKDYLTFKRSAQKEVNYLVKEFECRKAADSYARASISRTGVLDTARLHTYKFNDDIFKKVTTLADGKNHGLIFVLDWSGSMGNVLLDTIKQLYNLMWFCKKVSIPFEVYAFTSDWGVEYEPGTHTPVSRYEAKDGLIEVGCCYSLLNLFTSKVSSRELEKQMLNIYRIAFTYRRGYGVNYRNPQKLSLSGTPLNEALVTLHSIIPQFKRENKLQKVQCVVLTDGEAAPLKRHVLIQPRNNPDPDASYVGLNYIQPDNTFLRDRKTGHIYKMGNYDYIEFTNLLIRNLRDSFPDVNFIGMRILQPGDVGNFVRSQTGYNSKEFINIMADWKKQKSFAIKSSGYHTYFGLSANALNSSTQFSVAEDASKSQIKSAFVKSLSSKKMNKKILGEFISLVA